MDIVPVLAGAVFAVVGAFILSRGVVRLRLWRTIAKTPTSPCRGVVAPGPVEVVGQVEADAPTEPGPFSGTPAAFGEWRIDELRRSGKNNRWVKVASGRVGGRFRVRDETGAVRVEPEGAELDLEATFKADSSLGVDPPPRVMAFLQARRIEFEGIFGANKRMRYHEHLLVPGQRVYVLGTAFHAPDARLAVGLGDAGFPFLVSHRSEAKAGRHAFWSGVGTLAMGIVSTGVGLVVLRLGLG